MSSFLPDPVRGFFSLIVLALNTLFWSFQLILVALIKRIFPKGRWRVACDKLLNAIAQNWVACNSLGLHYTKDIRWDVEGLDALKPDAWYLVIANHQTWVDIVVLQKIFHGKIPVLKFFLKKELIWVPVLGLAWWALDYPFMRRSSSIHKDVETAREACEKFRLVPVSVMNFVEGTRFTHQKRQEQGMPFENLLKPKAVGISIVLQTMGEQLQSILDVSIVYPGGVQGIWEFLCSRSMEITVRVRQLPVTKDLLGDYFKDREFRRGFNERLNSLWGEKDQLIGSLLQKGRAGTQERL